MNTTAWVYCPVCGNKTRTMIREDTEMKNFPLYCPKCKKETIINVEVLWSSIFVTLVAKKYRFMQFELDMVFDTH